MTRALLAAFMATCAFTAGFGTAMMIVQGMAGRIVWTAQTTRQALYIYLGMNAVFWVAAIGARLVQEMIL